MPSAAGLLLLVNLLLAAPAEAHVSSGKAYHASVGHLLILRCEHAGGDLNVTWGSGHDGGGGGPLPLPHGVQVRDAMLWFLPVQASHNRSYTCLRRDGARLTLRLLVSVGTCPASSETVTLHRGISSGFPCKQDEVRGLTGAGTVRWMKECAPLRPGLQVYDSGLLRLPAPLPEDSGKYTCLVDVSVDGQKYTAARSSRVNVKDGIGDTIYAEPLVVRPQNAVVEVTLGQAVELECLAYIGFSDSSVSTYWLIANEFDEEFHDKGVNVSVKEFSEDNRMFRLLTLTIREVIPEFLNVPFQCVIKTPVDRKTGEAWLQEANSSAAHAAAATYLGPSLLALVLAAACLLFKIDLLLAHRRLRACFSRERAPVGKLYDAYVSFLHPAASGANHVESFALWVLPEKLEKQHGYSLYIRGRDDCPGEAMPDAVAATMCQCRRLIIILSPVAKRFTHDQERTDQLLSGELNQLAFEQNIGLFDALTRNDPKVLLVEIGSVDYSYLPESLRYLKRKQGALKWRDPSLASSRLSKLFMNRNFWKNLIYCMPSVPVGTLRTAC